MPMLSSSTPGYWKLRRAERWNGRLPRSTRWDEHLSRQARPFRIVLVEACMKRIYIAITVLMVSAQAFLPTTASARQIDEAQTTPGQLRGQSSIGAAQGPTAGPRSSAGGRLLRNAL